MRPLAKVLNASGHMVSGSDRSYDQGVDREGFGLLLKEGISLFPQNGEVFEGEVERVVVSSAIEEENPDLLVAQRKGVPIIQRAELLAEITNPHLSIGVAGTSGKTTTCGMIGYLLQRLHRDPTIINGGMVLDLNGEDAVLGKGDLVVYEADESDGCMSLYCPTIGVITNVELDHMPLPQLIETFAGFARNVKETLVLHQAYIEPLGLGYMRAKIFSFGLEGGDLFPQEYRITEEGIFFRISDLPYSLPILGLHNLLNALGAVSVLKVLGFGDEEISKEIRGFRGIRGRLEFLAQERGIKIYHDYAHNPDKIRATITTLQPYFKRLILIFQPHGYGPTRFLKAKLIETFCDNLREEDILFIQEIYYAGGKVERDISSNDLVTPLKKSGKRVFYSPCRSKTIESVVDVVKEGDAVVVMGARDRTLEGFAKDIARAI